MIFKLIELDRGVSKSGVEYHRCTIMGKFSSYGKVKTVTQEINLDEEDYNFLVGKEGKDFDFDIICPQSNFPFSLSSSVLETNSLSPTIKK